MKCNNCGQELSPSAKFCRCCGTKQEKISEQISEITSPIVVFNEQLSTKEIAPIASVVGHELPDISPAHKSPKKNRTWEYIAISVFLLGTVSSIGYWGWTQKQAAQLAEQQLVLKQEAEKTRLEMETKQKLVDESNEAARKLSESKTKEQLSLAIKCDSVQSCKNIMLSAAIPRVSEIIEIGASRIEAMQKPSRIDPIAADEMFLKVPNDFVGITKEVASEYVEPLKQAIKLDQLNVNYKRRLAQVYLSSDSPQEAKNVMLEALLFEPRNPYNWFLLAIIEDQLEPKTDVTVRVLLVAYEFSDKNQNLMNDIKSYVEHVKRPSLIAAYSAAMSIFQGSLN